MPADYDSRDLEAAERLARDDAMPDDQWDVEEQRDRTTFAWRHDPENPPEGPEEEIAFAPEPVYPNGHFCHRLPECIGRSGCPRDIACTH